MEPLATAMAAAGWALLALGFVSAVRMGIADVRLMRHRRGDRAITAYLVPPFRWRADLYRPEGAALVAACRRALRWTAACWMAGFLLLFLAELLAGGRG